MGHVSFNLTAWLFGRRTRLIDKNSNDAARRSHTELYRRSLSRPARSSYKPSSTSTNTSTHKTVYYSIVLLRRSWCILTVTKFTVDDSVKQHINFVLVALSHLGIQSSLVLTPVLFLSADTVELLKNTQDRALKRTLEVRSRLSHSQRGTRMMMIMIDDDDDDNNNNNNNNNNET